MSVEVNEGEYAERMPWQLIVPYESEADAGSKPCRHAALVGAPIRQLRSDGSVYGHTQRFSLSAGVAECKNEGGYNCTILCLACLDEARENLR